MSDHLEATSFTPTAAQSRAVGLSSRAPRPVKRSSSWTGLIWVLPALALLGVFIYFPLVDNLWFSLVRWNIFTGHHTYVGAQNYDRMVHDPVFWRALGNNVWYAVVSIAVQVFGSLVLAAVVESVRNDRWRKALRAIYFVPSAISLTVAGLLFYFIYQPQTGILDGLLSLIGFGSGNGAVLGYESSAIFGIIAMSQWQGFGYSTLLFAVALQRIPDELYEAASIDGIGPVRRFFSISAPLVREMTSLMIIVSVSGAFQVFNEVTVMTSGGPNNSSQVLGTWLYHAAFYDNDFGYAAAIATAIFVVTLVLALLQLWVSQRRKVEW